MPLKQPEKSVTLKSPLPPTSQIPGLGDLAKAPHEVPSGCRRKWIKETDSAYVRLAKQGGRPDLLKHHAPVTRRSFPAAHAVPDWYSHCSNSPATNKPRSIVSSLPDYMIHREFKADDHHGNSYEPRRGPFDFDMKSVWQRDAEDKENTEKMKNFLAAISEKYLGVVGDIEFNAFVREGSKLTLQQLLILIEDIINSLDVKLPAINPKYPSRIPNVSTTKEFSGKNKLSFPPVPAQRKSEAVNFSKLISNGYGTDWLQQCTGWEKKIQETSENSEQTTEPLPPDSKPSQSESAPSSNKSKPPFEGYNK